jgi:hypothetical protein
MKVVVPGGVDPPYLALQASAKPLSYGTGKWRKMEELNSYRMNGSPD